MLLHRLNIIMGHLASSSTMQPDNLTQDDTSSLFGTPAEVNALTQETVKTLKNSQTFTEAYKHAQELPKEIRENQEIIDTLLVLAKKQIKTSQTFTEADKHAQELPKEIREDRQIKTTLLEIAKKQTESFKTVTDASQFVQILPDNIRLAVFNTYVNHVADLIADQYSSYIAAKEFVQNLQDNHIKQHITIFTALARVAAKEITNAHNHEEALAICQNLPDQIRDHTLVMTALYAKKKHTSRL